MAPLPAGLGILDHTSPAKHRLNRVHVRSTAVPLLERPTSLWSTRWFGLFLNAPPQIGNVKSLSPVLEISWIQQVGLHLVYP